ncbi:MAG TPA: hypothetical protein VN541_09825 [Tepidisphaeraceae bacterium]|nr:hypothetical protein [Tepidisphaeraceae bacterium]
MSDNRMDANGQRETACYGTGVSPVLETLGVENRQHGRDAHATGRPVRLASWRLGGLLFVLVLASCLLPSIARGQAGASLLVKPWEADQTLEDNTSGYLFSGGHTNETRDRFHMWDLESQGRLRLFPGNEASPRVGYDMTYIGVHTTQPNFPGELLDLSVAGGTFLSKNNGWVTGVTLGAGYAGNAPFACGRAWYGRADFVLAKKFSDTDALGIGLDYDGHRTYAPDIPLPGFGYSHQFDPTILMVIGVPVTSITWKPIPHLRAFADWVLLRDADVDIGYEFIPHWTVFGAFQSRDDAFHVTELPGNRRLLYQQRRVEMGLRFQAREDMTLSLAGGYAFDTDFRAGFDLRDYSRVLYASNEPFLSVEVRVQF